MGKMDLAKSIARSVGFASIASMGANATAHARDIDDVTRDILDAKGRVIDGYLTIGARLIEAKSMLPHGEWLPWLAERVDISERHAQNLMRVAREYSNPQTLAGLGLSKAVALLDLPAGEREDFIRAEPVAEMSTRELERTIKERNAALLAEAAALEHRATQAENRIKELEAAREDVRREMQERVDLAEARAALATADHDVLAKAAYSGEVNADTLAAFRAICTGVESEVNRLHGMYIKAISAKMSFRGEMYRLIDALDDKLMDILNEEDEEV